MVLDKKLDVHCVLGLKGIESCPQPARQLLRASVQVRPAAEALFVRWAVYYRPLLCMKQPIY